MVLGRIIRLTRGESHSIIKPARLTKVFVLGDVVSFLAQSGGGGMMANAKTAADQQKGQHIITAGLVIQIVFFGFFIVVAGLFHRRISHYPTPRSKDPLVPWEKLQYVLYGGSCMIMVRSIYRLAEYVQGNDGALMQTEVYLYVFDATLMFLTSFAFNIFHPGQVISQEALEKDEPYMLGDV
ncbi:putative rta1 domain protein [Neofusicoccum parvum UCRNP2]|uniref:Putative rta1 domain protein n=1 Tax=Botryosphaeria parva (strain UCR-NP2) TaxID=1287680 RepID=R1GFN5_BOTPV|nr:putative rta1 domain protein [Neofusicoccum parvum UCRNP2]